MKFIIKRDNRTEIFDHKKIYDAILKSLYNTHEKYENLYKLVDKIVLTFESQETVNVEQIQDQVEKTLMESKLFETAKKYILYRQQRNEHRTKYGINLKNVEHIETPFSSLGYITYKRTYARKLHENDPNNDESEEFEDTIMRILNACQTQLKIGFTKQELERARYYFLKLKCLPAGRALWQLGTKTVEKLGMSSLQNCAFVSIDEPIKPFSWAFNFLMLGSGVGFNIQKKHVDKIPSLLNADIVVKRQDTNDADFIVPDSRIGWCKLLEEVLKTYFVTGESFSYSTILIRGKGTVIKTFGGVASGPEILCEGINNICNILKTRKGQKLRPIDCLDIMDVIGTIVVAGGSRRSALMCLGDYDDIAFLKAKNWSSGNIPNWRSMSNHSVVVDDIDKLPQEFWDGYMGNGEPYGLINLELGKKVGRICDGTKYPDLEIEGVNPCGEILLPNRSTCNLSEIFLNNVTTYEELKDIATILYKICKHTAALPCHSKETEEIVHKEMRVGISVSGYLSVPEIKKKWLSDLYSYLREYDIDYSKKNNFPISVKLTTVKPSGTISLLANTSAGCHPALFEYYIRRIQFLSSNPLVDICRKHNYKVEYRLNFDGTYDYSTVVVEFPCKSDPNAILAKNLTAIQQLDVVKRLQTEWSDNSISVTCYYKLEELNDIKKWLVDNYANNIKSVSFLLKYESGFKQMPYEEITKEQYDELINKTIPITSLKNVADEVENNFECNKGFCPIK